MWCIIKDFGPQQLQKNSAVISPVLSELESVFHWKNNSEGFDKKKKKQKKKQLMFSLWLYSYCWSDWFEVVSERLWKDRWLYNHPPSIFW